MKPLTRRQCEVLTLLARGVSMQQAALKLQIKYQVVKNYLCDAYERLGLQRRCVFMAIVKAVRTGQITLG